MEMYYKFKTNKNVETAFVDLKESLEKRGYFVQWQMNFKDKLLEQKVHFENDYLMFEICKAEYLKKALDQTLLAGYIMPCKIVVYEDGGSVYIGLVNFRQLLGMLDPALTEMFAVVEKEIMAAIEEGAK
jgi:uncharacterized protein (DUF302 family)